MARFSARELLELQHAVPVLKYSIYKGVLEVNLLHDISEVINICRSKNIGLELTHERNLNSSSLPTRTPK